MIRLLRILTVLFAVSALTATAALAADPVQVTGFSRAQVPAYDAQGKPLSAVPASAFKLPITSSEAGVGSSVGLPYQGKTIYVRRIDLTLAKPPACATAAQLKARGPGVLNAGDRHSAGASTDCLVGGK